MLKLGSITLRRGLSQVARKATIPAFTCRTCAATSSAPPRTPPRRGDPRTRAPLPASAASAHATAAPMSSLTAAPADGGTAAAADVAPAPDPKLAALRAAMAAADGGKGVDALLVPSEDPHMSEYPPDCFKRREWLTNFTGSAGTAVVLRDSALLWTDGRYFLQAERELGSEWTLMRAGTGNCPEIPDWLAEVLPRGARVGIDPLCHTIEAVRALQGKLQAKGQVLVTLGETNPVDTAWGDARPPMPSAPLRLHPLRWAGQSVADKVAAVRARLQAAGCQALLVPSLDEVAWLTNCRGGDVGYNPVFVAYALVASDAATLYTSPQRVPPEVGAALAEGGFSVKEYGALLADVAALAAKGAALWMDASKVPYAIYAAAQQAAAAGPRGPRKRKAAGAGGEAAAGVRVVEEASPIVGSKAIKNDAELAGFVEAHLRDAAALADFLRWLEVEVASGAPLDEVGVDAALTARRAAQPGFIEPSFPTIAGANAHGAVIHYRATPATAARVDESTLLLLDSGGQYDCGTTDVTRTVHLGTPTPHQRRCFTRVLQGHIALDRAVFPEGTPGAALDALARLALWREGLNYRHGTGHGVGAALNVHEGPQSISTRYWITVPLQAGMVVSNEPGYYEDGRFGVRIENLVFIREADTEFRFGGSSYFAFEALTLVPIQARMIDLALLTKEEEGWLDAYHDRVWREVSPRLEDKPETLEWLRLNTLPIRQQLGGVSG